MNDYAWLSLAISFWESAATGNMKFQDRISVLLMLYAYVNLFKGINY